MCATFAQIGQIDFGTMRSRGHGRAHGAILQQKRRSVAAVAATLLAEVVPEAGIEPARRF